MTPTSATASRLDDMTHAGIDIVSLGEPLYELSRAADGATWRSGFGGDTSNMAVAAARTGARTAYLTAVGDDAFGREFLELWRREGIDTSGVQVRNDAHTGVYFITYDGAGHHFSYLRAGSAASRMGPADLPLDLVRSAKALHVSGISLAISAPAADACFAAIHAARDTGRLVQIDTNLRLRLWALDRARAVIHAAVALADICRPGLDDARQLTGLKDADAIADAYLAMGPKIVALTLGADGALIATPGRRERLAPHPCKPIDATAAGDAFDGAFLAEVLRTGDPFRAGRFANAAAALSTEGYGAVGPMPRRADVERALAERSSPRQGGVS
jgi:2-dehydro-3-deoxygluconokinase